MNRPLLGVGIVLVAFGLIAGAVAFSFRDDWRDDHDPVEYRVLNQDGHPSGSVVVLDDGGRWDGPGFFPFFPLIVVFERFRKGADSRGQGLGLAIAKRLVEAHGGQIRVKSTGTGGTVFLVRLPVHI
jgi:hypothetical protein